MTVSAGVVVEADSVAWLRDALARALEANKRWEQLAGELREENARLRAENERLKNRQTRGVSLKVSEKGGVSVYGLGRFPVTLYKEQWSRLLDMADDIRAFIRENESKLKAKSD